MLGCTTYYAPLGSIEFLSPVKSKIDMEKLLSIINPVLDKNNCDLVRRNISDHPAGFSFHYVYECRKKIRVSFSGENIIFNYISDGDFIKEQPRPYKKDWYSIFVNVKSSLDEKWDQDIEARIYNKEKSTEYLDNN